MMHGQKNFYFISLSMIDVMVWS